MSTVPEAPDAERATLLHMARDEKVAPEFVAELARRHTQDLEVCLTIAENPAATDDTLAFLARNAHPSVRQTLVEDRNLLERVPDLREELAGREAGDEASDEGKGPDTPEGSGHRKQKAVVESVRGLNIAQKMVLAVRGSKSLRMLLIRDANETVALATLFSPKMTDTDVLVVANMRDVGEKILRAIAEDRRYKANRYIALALLTNPKTPVSVSLGLGLNNLTDKELSGLARNRNVPAALSRAARGLMDKRAEKSKPQEAH